MKKFAVLDIETKPNVEKALELAKPFDPADVKTGNMGEEKAQAKIAKARADYEANIKDKASLHPWSGEIVAIGLRKFLDPNCEERSTFIRDTYHFEGGEKELIEDFWDQYLGLPADCRVYFWSGCGNRSDNFDLDFLEFRSWVLGVKVPDSVRTPLNGKMIKDLTPIFLQGRYNEYCSLERAARRLGVFDPLFHNKKEDFPDAKDIWKCFESDDKTDRIVAFNYLHNDLILTESVAKVIGR